MSSSSDFELIHGQLHVTKDEAKPELLGRGPCAIRGSQYSQCPAVFGNDKTFDATEGTVMIGPLKNTDAPFPIVCGDLKFINRWEIEPCGAVGVGMRKGKELLNPYSLVVRKGTPIVDGPEACAPRCEGPKKGPAAAIFIGDVDFYENVRIKEKLSVVDKADFHDDVVIKGNIRAGDSIHLKDNLVAQGEVKSNCGGHVLSNKKNFDIPHPSKEGWRLRHTCPEGPTNDVYIRGRVKNKNQIDLPRYWENFVDPLSITVSLTPIGAHQNVIIKRISDNKVYLQAAGGMPIDCYYHIFAERIDGDKLIAEYKGLTPDDYPGDNSEYNINI